jgi:hypothetical protein
MLSRKSIILTNGYIHHLLVLSTLSLVRYEVLTELISKILIFCNATLCR